MPRVEARCATSRPIEPKPTKPRVAPASSRGRGRPRHISSCAQICFCWNRTAAGMAFAKAKICAMTCSATTGPCTSRELVIRRGRRMDPAQAFGLLELLRAEGPGNGDFSVAEVLFDAFVAGEMGYFKLREVMAQALR